MSSHTTWPPAQIARLERRFNELESVVGDASRVSERPDEEQIWLTRFLVVRSAGYLEQVVYETARGYVLAKCYGMVSTFARSWIERTRNPSPSNLLELCRRFDVSLAERFDQYLDEDHELRRQDLALLIQRRNDIAHGQNEGVGLQKALRLAATAREVADWFVLELAPDASRPSRK